MYSNYLMRSSSRRWRQGQRQPRVYVYLAESIQAWPAQRGAAQRVSGAGWGRVQWRNLSGGIVALHRATKPVKLTAAHTSTSRVRAA